jgi:hypothetical protein
MAVSRATGYTNLPNDNFIPEIYSQKVQKFFRTASVVEDITNTDYAGEIENFGDTVRIIKEPVVTVASYTRGSTINTQELADDQITLVVDQANAFAFKVDDIEERHSHINFESVASSSGAYALKNAYDQNIIAAMFSGAGTTCIKLITLLRQAHLTTSKCFLDICLLLQLLTILQKWKL